MMSSLRIAEASTFIGSIFNGESCDRCGRMDALEPFRFKIVFKGISFLREERLCSKCISKVNQRVCISKNEIEH